MKSYLVFLLSLIFISCGEIHETESFENLNSTFALTDLTSLTEDELVYTADLCSILVAKERSFRDVYLSKFFHYNSTIQECTSDEPTTKTITLNLQRDLTFSATADAEYAFLIPELSDNNSTFSKFCQSGLSTRYVSSSDYIYHFNISKKNNQYVVNTMSSFYHEVVDSKKEYKIFKRENLIFNANATVNYPAGIVVDRSSESVRYCSSPSQRFIKRSTLESIRD